MTLTTGIHFITDDAYHADPCPAPSLSSSQARTLLNKSPCHAWLANRRLNPDFEETTSATFDIGKVCHALLLGRGAQYVAIPDDLLGSNGSASTKAAKEFIADARDAGAVPLKGEEIHRADTMAQIACIRLAERNVTIDHKRTELAAIAEIDGIWCRALIDYAPETGPLYDYKTTTDASPDACIKAIHNYGYDVQAAWYLDVWKAATGEDRRFRFIFQEKDAPHEVQIVELVNDQSADSDWFLDARSKGKEARRIWRECLEADQWPGYPAEIVLAGAPHWYRQKWADREIGKPVITKPSAAAKKAAHKLQAPEGMNA